MSILTANSSSTNILEFKPPEPRGYFKLLHAVLGSTNWQSLDSIERDLFIEVAARYTGFNNGRVPYSVRDGKAALRRGHKKIRRSFDNLQARNLLACEQEGTFNFSTKAKRDAKWRLTDFALGTQPSTVNVNDHCAQVSTVGTQTVLAASTNRLLDLSIDKKEKVGLPKEQGESKPSDSPFSLPAFLQAIRGGARQGGGGYLSANEPAAMAALAAWERARQEHFGRDDRGGCLLNGNQWTAFKSFVTTQLARAES